jgi:zinc protease
MQFNNPRRRFLWILLPPLGLALIAASLAPPARAAAVKGETVEGITEYRLDNGLQVLLYPDKSKPTVTVNLTVLVGSRQEGYGETGMAHLLEHMLFKGTPNNPAIPKALKDRGANFNGTTSVDRTNYYETLPALGDNLEFALSLEADRLVNSFVRSEDLIMEMTVVRNEFERGENMPGVLLNQRVMATAFEWHNYGKSTIGNRSDIERVPIGNLQAFYRKYYQPDNAMLVVAGAFEPAKALELVEKYFGPVPKSPRKLVASYTEEPPQDGERLVTLRRVGDLGLVNVVYHVPSGSHPDNAPLEVLAGVLDTPPAGRLYKALVETHLASDVGAGVTSYHDPGVFEVEAEVRKENSLDTARGILIDIAEKMADEGVSDEEVERVKRQILKNRELAAADTSMVAISLSNWASRGDWRLYFLHRDRIEKVKTSDVKEVAARYLKQSNRTVGLFIPTEKVDRAAVPESPDVAKMLAGYHGREAMASGEAFDVSPSNVEARCKRSTLTAGVKLALLPKKTRGETVSLRLTLRYGALDNLKGYESAADFLPTLMTRGTKNLSRQQIQDTLDKNEATLVASGDVGVATFHLETKRARLPAVLQLLREILREPSLPDDEFEIYRGKSLASWDEKLTDPQSLAVLRARRTLSPFDKSDVRYIATVEEEIARDKALTLEQIKKLYGDFLGSQAVELAIVGDFDVDACLPALRETFTGWTGKQSYARLPKQVFPDVKSGKQEIVTPDKANAVYFSGQAFPMKDDHPDYPALVMGNFVLGGGSLSSRLGDRVRQKEGLSYGVGSMFGADAFDPRASFSIYAISNPQNTDKVVTAIREEIDRLLKDGVTPEELERAKRGYLDQQQVSRARDTTLASQLVDTAYVGRTMRYYADLEKKIGSLTPEQVREALRKYVDANKMVVVIAGDFRASAEGKPSASDKR